ncbi:splicing factor, suppressor of white-apricot homolog isoform X2 [Liolophura sinensis]|uniref:splicing factor, suppressor of white-apricot homolog isoform X2 n=1 Tax=Liolophura sinensis TaxID=3198878 RepID=UPI0031587CF9
MDELFVFGYGCKIFRDDEKAMYIEEKRHLIPWMGDDKLMIDRYDGRGHLYDLNKYDASNVTHEPWMQMESERALEAACDEERYLELHVDLAEQAVYEEEEWKRYYESLGGDSYKAMGFNYDYDGTGAHGMPPGYDQEVEDTFVPPAELAIPDNMEIPRSDKENVIIEKTAKFIAEHGAQMEIMIKAKQKDNPQFEFMEHDHPINLYFKHMVKMIKTGKYNPVQAPKPNPPEKQDSSYDDNDEEHHGYLHPSLMSSITMTAPSKPVPKPVVRVHETPYGDLIKSVTKSMRNDVQQNSDQPENTTPPLAPPPLPPFMAQDVYGPSQKKLPPPPGLEPVTLPNPGFPHSSDHEVLSGHEQQGFSKKNTSKKHIQGEITVMGPQIVPPAPDIQPIIDRMALYVAKNGVDFETVVKSKNDTRFDFLNPGHMHYAYYDFRKRLHLEELEQEKSEDDDRQNSSKGVSFKLKTKEQENTQLDKRKAFDYESTDDEDEEDKKVKEGHQSPSEPRDPVVPTEKPNQTTQEDIEKKKAEEKLKDRLALAAREKLAQASKEEQIKAERKRKAAMFITLLKSGNQAAGATDDKPDVTVGDAGSGPPSRTSSRPCTPYDLLSGKTSPDRPVSPGETTAPPPTSENQTAKAKGSLPRAYYGIPASMRRFPRSPTPPSSYSRGWRSRSRSRSPRRFPRGSSPMRWSDRSPRRFDRSSTSRRASPSPPRSFSGRSKSPGFDRRKARSKRSRSRSPKRSKRSPSHSKSKKKKHKKSRSKSRSPRRKTKSKESSHGDAKSKDPVTVIDLEPVNKGSNSACDDNSRGSNGVRHTNSLADCTSYEQVLTAASMIRGGNVSAKVDTSRPFSQVSDEKISKVKAMLKASRKAILKEEGVDLDL